MIAITCHGAAWQVTGSCHLLECAGRRVLIDCGLFQGSDAVENGNAANFGFDPASIDFVLPTHAHLDHCGRIPLLGEPGRDMQPLAGRLRQNGLHIEMPHRENA